MNHTEKFNETVSILVKAYLNDTLVSIDCAKCAVGNLVAAANGYTLSHHEWNNSQGLVVEPRWDEVVWGYRGKRGWDVEHQEGLRQINSTGYTIKEFERIEAAFMDGVGNEPEDDTHAGLMAVVDVLASIHSIDLATAAASKALFVKA